MKNYKVRINTRLCAVPWEYEFTDIDDVEALQRIRRVVETDFVGVSWAMSFDIFTTDTEDHPPMVTFGYDRHVANIRLNAPTTHFESNMVIG